MSSRARTRELSVNPTPFGTALRHLRVRSGLTQEELAERAGLSPDAISSLERGVRRRAQPKTVRALAAALGLSKAERIAFVASVSQQIDTGTDNIPRDTLPIPPTPLVGREREQAAALEVLEQADVRLLTLLGPGGVGKTRLGLAVAAAASDRCDAAYFIDLAPLHDASLVPSAIAHALDLQEQGGRDPLDKLAALISGKAFLLMLDNFEHLATAAPVVAELLARCPRLKVLVTSRAALRIRSEHIFSVPPLAVPDEPAIDAPSLSVGDLLSYPSVQLFVERTQAVAPGFVLMPTNAAAVAEICRRLDGLPLAIELAAARGRILPPAALLPQLTNRLALLTEGPVDAPARQRTLRQAINWSYDLLDAAEQALFRRLAVFTGGFTLEAAEEVSRHSGVTAPAVLDLIESLAGKSLLRRQGASDEATPRFNLLETIREYGLERLAASGEDVATRDAHATYFLALAERAELELVGPAQRQWLDRLEADHANLRVALEWLAERGDLDAALRLAAACSWFWWYRRHYAEGRARLEALLARTNVASHGRAWAAAMSGLGLLARVQGDNARAIQVHEAAVAAWRRLGDRDRLADALFQQGLALMYVGVEETIAVLSESVAISRTLPEPRWLGGGLLALGRALHYQGNLASAAEALEGSLARARELQNPIGIAVSLWGLGDLTWDQGDEGRGLTLLREALARLWDLGETWTALLCLERLAAIGARGQPRVAVRIFAAAAAWRAEVGLPLPPSEQDRYERALAVVRDALDADAFAAAWAAGQLLTPEEAITEVLDVERG